MSKVRVAEVKVGKLPYQSYAMGIIRAFQSASRVIVLARSVNIGKAVVSVQVARRTLENIDVESIDIFDEELQFPDKNNPSNMITRIVSCIRIGLVKK